MNLSQVDLKIPGHHQGVKRGLLCLAQAIEHRALHQAHTQICQQWRLGAERSPASLFIVKRTPPGKIMRRLLGCIFGNARGILNHRQHLGEILLKQGVQILGEPFRRQPLAGDAANGPAIHQQIHTDKQVR